ncbi:Permease of the drug/metabolite transporter (DMT) superfamily [plant metagenome]|uniref:Permease of the drug/metabolite transporter (DMT) superfamily n=1 Tax=plant metagenome TaxID=1297885 RepID=A0A484QBW4_9ZZZZ
MQHRNALLSIHAAAVLFGLTGIFGELIQASAAVITFGRALFALVSLAAFARLRGVPLKRGIDAGKLGLLAVCGILLAAHWVTFFIAVKVGGIAVATLGFASFPAFTMLLEGLFYRERIRLAEWGVLALVSLGLVLVVPSYDWADQGTVGLAWGLSSGLSFALLALLNRRSAKGADPVQVAWWQNLAVALSVAVFAVPELHALRTADWLWLAALGVFCTGLSHFLFVSSLQVIKARTAGLVIALEPVYAIAGAWLLFGQEPSARMMLGAALIILAIVLPARPK